MVSALKRDHVLLAAVVALGLVVLMTSPAWAQDGGATVTATDHDEHGEILADSEGMVLYLFTQDEGSTSTCYESCAENWPPLTVDGEASLEDGVAGELGTTERDDGSMQVTYNGMPLYYFAGDQEPGDTNGQGVGDIWFVIQPEEAAADSGDTGDAADEGTEDTADEGTDDTEDEGAGEGSDELPNTGGSTALYLYLGAALMAAGAVLWAYRRRLVTE